MAQIFPTDFEEKLTMAQDDYILFSDSEDGNKIKKAQYKNLKGEQGNPGQDGQDGAAATITVGTTSTLPAGSSATVSNTGTSSAAVFNFGIPKGDKGDPGNPGVDGNDGAAATITVGTTTTLPAGSSATVTNVGTSSAAIFNFGIPKGDSGSGSGDVNGPASSTDGHLAVFDGLTGKIIKDGGAVPTSFAPGGTATTGYVVTKTADGYERQAPTGGVTSVNSKTGAVTLNADDISDSTTTNKFVTATDKSTWNGKQDALTLPATPTQGNLVVRGANNKILADGGAIPTGVPSGGTDGQVLSKVSGSVAWAAPSGGDVMVSSQSGNILTSGMKIWAGTEADYGNLGTYDNNTVYLTF